MILIDQSTVPAIHRADLGKVNAELALLASARLNRIDLLDEPYVLSKLAWKVAIFSNSMTHRFIALAEGVGLSWNACNYMSAVLNARAMVETFASYHEFSAKFSKLVPTNDFAAIDDLATKALFGTRDEDLLKEFPELNARQILNSIDVIDKKLLPGFRNHYEGLSEFCHPNSFGHRGAFSSLDQKTGITSFGIKSGERFVVAVKCALGSASLFKRSVDSIGEDIKTLARAHHAASLPRSDNGM